ncbi:DUF305 domain-containing protein [Sphaerisporangium corydalis]|uniref:DUF305 domain-containing protein n=1 Tax=Sphaerisporangium corydalis TaxID=1441875 RepID=A0ABV9E7I0_9ACTN|nr:DUF305 domain-containing protein [Sphaerisporangium corydalis]
MRAAAAYAPTARGITSFARRAAAAVALAASLATTGCAATAPVPNPPAAPGGTAASPSPAAFTAAGDFGPTDVAWVELMIPMDEQLLRMLAVVPARTTDPDVRRLAARIGTGHRAELVKLRQLLLRSGVPETNPHQGHNMPGMVTPDELTVMGRASGAAFETLLTGHLREHLKQSVLVAQGEQRSGTSEDTRTLAATVERTRTSLLADLTALGD